MLLHILVQHTLPVQIIVPVIITRHNSNILVQHTLPIHNWSVQVTGLVISYFVFEVQVFVSSLLNKTSSATVCHVSIAGLVKLTTE